MDVFISWSGERSKQVARGLRDWLTDPLQAVRPWMSGVDIEPGTRWSAQIAAALASMRVGILCVTPDNQLSPWLTFEAGALAKALDDSFLIPYLIDFAGVPLSNGPLTQFQYLQADEVGTRTLVSTINARMQVPLDKDRLDKAFRMHWPSLRPTLESSTPKVPSVKPDVGAILIELLNSMRQLERRMATRSVVNQHYDADDIPVADIIRKAERLNGQPLMPGENEHVVKRLAADRVALGTLAGLSHYVMTHLEVSQVFRRVFASATGIELKTLPDKTDERA